jgi:hypothetical protein
MIPIVIGLTVTIFIFALFMRVKQYIAHEVGDQIKDVEWKLEKLLQGERIFKSKSINPSIRHWEEVYCNIPAPQANRMVMMCEYMKALGENNDY